MPRFLGSLTCCFFPVSPNNLFQEVDDELRKLALETTTTLCEGAAGMMRKQENFSARMVFTLFKVGPPLFSAWIEPQATSAYISFFLVIVSF